MSLQKAADDALRLIDALEVVEKAARKAVRVIPLQAPEYMELKSALTALDKLDAEADWQIDVDDDNAAIGICPRCGSVARQDPDATVTRMKCTECGERE